MPHLLETMIGGAVAEMVNAAFARTENFEGQQVETITPARAAIVTLITVFLMVILLLLVGKYLWNNILTELIPAIKPVKNVWQLLGFAVLLSLIHPGNCRC